MAFTQIDIGNQALAMVGSAPIAAWDDGSAEGQQIGQHYEVLVGLALTSPGGAPMRWSFATRQDTLTKLAGTPEARYAFAYQIPADVLRLHAVTQNGMPIRYAIHSDAILTDQDNALNPIVADYTFRAQEPTWPPDFTACFVHELASRLALGLNENRALANALKQAADWRGARTADSQSHTSPRLRATRLTSARFSGRGAYGFRGA